MRENPYDPATRSKLMHALFQLSSSLCEVSASAGESWWKTPDVLDWLASDCFDDDLETLRRLRDEALYELELEDCHCDAILKKANG